ncbi:hypothetical protein SASPL_126964 [Salvia splendens]|uniref:Xyloglucan endotransglucosylase/hydrolase n=1 Tax=Salvia splendens TaxID=180675 RepID=A0A8X8XHX1_SALSN|nr:hypothetical protein SASPL_126964 [Salvia splendens]
MFPMLILLLAAFAGSALAGRNFNQDFDITWGEGRGKILDDGKLLTLSLDKASGSGFRSKNQYMFGKVDMQIKLVAGGVSMCRFAVDGTPIRQFKNHESKGIPYPENQPMWIFSSLWDAEDWATRGGLVKTDWTQAPFTASYKHFNALACTSPSGSCSNNSSANSWFSQSLDNLGMERIKWVQKNYMIYNYCTDSKRFPNGFPPECSII